MLPRRIRLWLEAELPEWKARGWLNDASAAEMAAWYGGLGREAPSSGAAGALVAIVGSLLVSAGVILLLAHNWSAFAKPVRLAIALLPLAGAQAAAAARWQRAGPVWRESAGVAWSAAVAAALALLGQVYHVASDAESFLLTWTLLAAAVGPVVNAVLPSIIFLATLVGWAFSRSNVAAAGAAPLLFWALWGLPAGQLAVRIRRQPDSVGGVLLAIALAMAALIGLPATLGEAIGTFWNPVFAAAFIGMVVLGGALRHRGRWQAPLRAIGWTGLSVLAIVTSSVHVRPGCWLRATAATVVEELLAAGLVTAVLAASAIAWRRRSAAARLAFLQLPLAIVWLWLGREALYHWAYAAYALLFGGAMATEGLRRDRLGMANLGLATTVGAILVKFFEQEVPFAARGAAFAATGLALLTLNTVLLRRTRRQGTNQ